jgi:hypothetical protein
MAKGKWEPMREATTLGGSGTVRPHEHCRRLLGGGAVRADRNRGRGEVDHFHGHGSIYTKLSKERRTKGRSICTELQSATAIDVPARLRIKTARRRKQPSSDALSASCI